MHVGSLLPGRLLPRSGGTACSSSHQSCGPADQRRGPFRRAAAHAPRATRCNVPQAPGGVDAKVAARAARALALLRGLGRGEHDNGVLPLKPAREPCLRGTQPPQRSVEVLAQGCQGWTARGVDTSLALGASRIFTYRNMPEHTGAAPAAQSPRPLLDTLAGNLPSCDSCLTSATPKSTGCNQKQHTNSRSSEDSEAWHQVPSQRSSSARAPPAARRCGLSSGPAQPQKGAPQCTPESCKRALPGLLQPHGAYKAQRGTNWGCLQKWPCALVRTSGYSTCVQVEACSCHVMRCSP